MKERPILFSGPMVRAILDGRKTQTRRVVKPQPPTQPFQVHGESSGDWFIRNDRSNDPLFGPWRKRCPYGQSGDRLWVRESVRIDECPCQAAPAALRGSCRYCKGRGELVADHPGDSRGLEWRPSIHMPRWASRLTLEITDVRVQRLQEISGRDVAAEGFPFSSDLDQFKLAWNELNARRGFSWESNPWVWAVTFKRLEGDA